MVAFINKYTGSTMFVDESRAAEYEALGHTRAAEVIVDVEAVEITSEEVKQPKPQAKKSASRKKDPKEW